MTARQPESPTVPAVKHGTYAGVSWHRAHRVPVCDPCRAADRDYMRARRAAKPEARDYDRKYSRAHRRALLELSRQFPAEFLALLQKHRSAQDEAERSVSAEG